MGSYAYCVVPLDHRPPAGLSGVGGAPVEHRAVGPVALWVSSGERPQLSAEAITEHNRVVEVAVTEAVTPVPLRFGQWLDDPAALVATVSEQADRYGELLARFAGCLEFGLRILEPATGEEAQDVRGRPTSGREYMETLQAAGRLAEAKRARAGAMEAEVRAAVGAVVRDERAETAQTRQTLLAVAHLVARPDFNEYRERARGLRSTHPELRFLLSGPWPPYSFAV